MRYSVLQCVSVCCSAMQCGGRKQGTELLECCSVLQCVAMCCSVLQHAAACCSELQCDGRKQETQVLGVFPGVIS